MIYRSRYEKKDLRSAMLSEVYSKAGSWIFLAGILWIAPPAILRYRKNNAKCCNNKKAIWEWPEFIFFTVESRTVCSMKKRKTKLKTYDRKIPSGFPIDLIIPLFFFHQCFDGFFSPIQAFEILRRNFEDLHHRWRNEPQNLTISFPHCN